MSDRKSRGCGLYLLLFLLFVLSGAAVLFFPVIEQQLPEAAAVINNLRGYYDGPLFSDPEDADDLPGNPDLFFTETSRGFRFSMEEENTFYFIPASDLKLTFSGSYEDPEIPLEIGLYSSKEPERLLAHNLDVPFITGRQADDPALIGRDLPPHANWFEYRCREGEAYILKVRLKAPDDIGKEVVVKGEISPTWLSVEELWGLFVIGLGVLFVLYIVIRISIWRASRGRGDEVSVTAGATDAGDTGTEGRKNRGGCLPVILVLLLLAGVGAYFLFGSGEGFQSIFSLFR